jgi:hypothetical protein
MAGTKPLSSFRDGLKLRSPSGGSHADVPLKAQIASISVLPFEAFLVDPLPPIMSAPDLATHKAAEGAQQPNRIAGLDDQRLVLVHRHQRLHDSLVRGGSCGRHYPRRHRQQGSMGPHRLPARFRVAATVPPTATSWRAVGATGDRKVGVQWVARDAVIDATGTRSVVASADLVVGLL